MENEVIQTALGPLTVLIVQAVKNVVPRFEPFAIPTVLLVAGLFAALLVDWSSNIQAALLSLAVMTIQVASMASGMYSWSKKESVEITIPDYSDES